jgi:hypothetical protein
MMKTIGRVLHAMLIAPVRGPWGWVRCALLLWAVYGVLHVLGWRDDMAIICGTGSPDGSRAMVYRGAAYGLAYVGAVVVGPILLLGAGIRAGVERVWG